MHKKCNVIRVGLVEDKNFRCDRCHGLARPIEGCPFDFITLLEYTLEVVDTFCHLEIVCTPSPFCWGRLNLLPNFQKGALDWTSTLRGGLLEKMEATFFKGCCNFTEKKLKYLMTKTFINENIFFCHNLEFKSGRFN